MTIANRKGKKNRAFSSLGFVFPVCFLLTLVLTIVVVPAVAQHPIAVDRVERVIQQSDASQLLERGRERYQQGQFFEAASFWERAAVAYGDRGAILDAVQALNYLSLAYHNLGDSDRALEAIATSLDRLEQFERLTPTGLAILAQALNTRGTLELARGQIEAALDTWKQAETTYDRAGDETGKLGSQINQAQALQAQGQYRRAKTLLEQVNERLQNQPDTPLKGESLRSLGVALQTIGDLLQSKVILEQSWAISDRLNSRADTSAVLFGIGNIARDFEKYDVALAYYQKAEQITLNPLTRVQSQLNQLSLFIETQKIEKARAIVPQIQSILSALPNGRPAIYGKVNLAESLMKLGGNSPEVAQVLASAVQQAQQLRDRRAQAYALNQLGKLYEQNQQWTEARNLTQKALQLAETIDAHDITARAAWQLGRILKQDGEIEAALSAYQNAFDRLQSLRSDLVAINPDVQFSFRESVEPVYREFVSLLLQPDASQDQIKQAREVIEALQLAELDNFFRDACLDTQPVVIDEIDREAAAIYPIILRDRLEVILSLPNRPLSHYATLLSNTDINRTLQEFYATLNPAYSPDERLRVSQQIYNWLIEPAETAIESSGIKTLVFVPDGWLRSLPMAALYDGGQYLIEKYAIAVSPGLQLFPQGLEREKLNVLAAGLTEARQGFVAIPAVKEEVQHISSEVDAKVLLDREFTIDRLENQIDRQSFRVIHLATHGQFSSNPEETFLLTWNDRINVKDFDLLFQKRRLGTLEPIDLLVMSACQTATGDKRATLGLAGLALRSGARSTLASLWSVNDQVTADLMSEFYNQITQQNDPITKAEALRQAQLAILNDPLHQHPFFWAPFILVGNWL